MAVAGVRVSLNTDEFKGFVEQVGKLFPPKQAANVLAPIIRKAINPVAKRLRQITPVGPTGNLKNAVASKVVQYAQDGVAVGIVGYTRAGRGSARSAAGGSVRAGKDRAFHQWWLEAGTQPRQVAKLANKPYQRKSPTTPYTRVRMGKRETVVGKGIVHRVSGQNAYIASSYNRLGPFKVLATNSDEGRVQTYPAYPKAFFKKSKTPIIIPAMPAGGTSGNPPVNTAWLETQAEVAAILQRELSLSLGQAWAALKYRESGTANGTDTL